MQLKWKRYTPSQTEIKRTSKYIGAAHSPGPNGDDGLVVYCYNRKCFADGHRKPEIWDKVTLNTRGNVFNHKGELLARGVPKIFNWSERDDPAEEIVEKGPARLWLFEKFCGHMSIVFWNETEQRWRIFTKQGCDHEFEEMDQEMLQRKQFYGWDGPVDKNMVYICEGINSQKDPHTIRYEKPGLYLLMKYNLKEDEFVIDTENYPGEVHYADSLDKAFSLQAAATHEGYVMFDVVNDVVLNAWKLKTDAYIERRAAMHEAKVMLQGGTTKKNMKSPFQQFKYDGILHKCWWDTIYVMDVLDDWFDDWWAANNEIIEYLEEKIETDMNFCEYNAWVLADRRHVLAVTKDVQLQKLIWAFMDKRWDRIEDIINRRLVPKYMKELKRVKE